MIMVNMLMIFGNISIYTPATFFLMRIWQGKSMLTSIVFPAILLIFFWLILLISSIYLVVKEADVRKKIIFGVMPLVVVVGFLFLITKKLYVKVSGIENADTYYRILWIISMYVTITYAFTKHIAILNGTVKNVLRLVLQLWLLQSRFHLYMQMNIYNRKYVSSAAKCDRHM